MRKESGGWLEAVGTSGDEEGTSRTVLAPSSREAQAVGILLAGSLPGHVKPLLSLTCTGYRFANVELEVLLWKVLRAGGPWAWTYFRGLAEVCAGCWHLIAVLTASVGHGWPLGTCRDQASPYNILGTLPLALFIWPVPTHISGLGMASYPLLPRVVPDPPTPRAALLFSAVVYV